MAKHYYTIFLITIGVLLLAPFFVEAESRIPKKSEVISAVLYFSNWKQAVNKGSVAVMVSPGQAINATGIEIKFDQTKVKAISIDKTNSYCELFIEEKIDNVNGKINLSCGKPYPGIATTSEIFKINFLKKRIGTSTLAFTDNNLVLANDGFGTDVLNEKKNFTILMK